MKSQAELPRAEVPGYLLKKHGVTYSPDYLRQLASRGNGPRYRRIGKYAFYSPADLDRWIASRTTPPLLRASEILLAK